MFFPRFGFSRLFHSPRHFSEKGCNRAVKQSLAKAKETGPVLLNVHLTCSAYICNSVMILKAFQLMAAQLSNKSCAPIGWKAFNHLNYIINKKGLLTMTAQLHNFSKTCSWPWVSCHVMSLSVHVSSCTTRSKSQQEMSACQFLQRKLHEYRLNGNSNMTFIYSIQFIV